MKIVLANKSRMQLDTGKNGSSSRPAPNNALLKKETTVKTDAATAKSEAPALKSEAATQSDAPRAARQSCYGVCYERPHNLWFSKLVPQLIILHSDEHAEKKCFYACDADPAKACANACRVMCTDTGLRGCKKACTKGCLQAVGRDSR
mmetsp:Transcript_14093/g.23323  ORF Transcript_14093/g.23323 Transcript_14093/m.23323 type:complete len:148 (+) Transcript_14093:1780-2223(+)